MTLDSYLLERTDSGFLRRYPRRAFNPRTHINPSGLRFRGRVEVGATMPDDLDVDDAVYLVRARETACVRDRWIGPDGRTRYRLFYVLGDVFGDLADAQPIRVPELTRRRG